MGELERVMASLETQIDETKNLLTDLERLLAIAVRMYKEARTKLVSEHTAGKGGLFALGQVHGDCLVTDKAYRHGCLNPRTETVHTIVDDALAHHQEANTWVLLQWSKSKEAESATYPTTISGIDYWQW